MVIYECTTLEFSGGRYEIVRLLEQQDVAISSVDFVRFTWLNKRSGQTIDSDEEEKSEQEDNDDVINVAEYDQVARIAPVEDGDRFVGNPTVWIGDIPGSLVVTTASEVAKPIPTTSTGFMSRGLTSLSAGASPCFGSSSPL